MCASPGSTSRPRRRSPRRSRTCGSRLTTARYQTPSGRAIQGKGLQPDLTVSPLKLEKVAQADRRREADLRGALKNPEGQRGSAGKPGGPGAPDKAPDKDANTTAA